MRLVIPPAPAFAGLLGNAIDRFRLDNGLLRRVVGGRCRAEDGYGTWPEDAKVHFQCQFKHIEQTAHIQVPRPQRLFLARGGKSGGEVVDMGNGVFRYHATQGVRVGNIKDFMPEGAGFRRRNVTGDDLRGAVFFSQRRG